MLKYWCGSITSSAMTLTCACPQLQENVERLTLHVGKGKSGLATKKPPNTGSDWCKVAMTWLGSILAVDMTPLAHLHLQNTDYDSFGHWRQKTIPEPKELFDKVINKDRPIPEELWQPCPLCNCGSNTIDHWCRFCPLPSCGLNALLKYDKWIGFSLGIPSDHMTGILSAHIIFHLRRLLRERVPFPRTTTPHQCPLWMLLKTSHSVSGFRCLMNSVNSCGALLRCPRIVVQTEVLWCMPHHLARLCSTS